MQHEQLVNAAAAAAHIFLGQPSTLLPAAFHLVPDHVKSDEDCSAFFIDILALIEVGLLACYRSGTVGTKYGAASAAVG